MAEYLNLKFLYYFSCETMDVLEVKVLGLADGTPIGRVYHWLYFDRDAEQLHKLAFKSMGTEGDKGLRSFEQGALWFDDTCAELTLEVEEVTKTFSLQVQTVDAVPESLVLVIQHFLQRELSD